LILLLNILKFLKKGLRKPGKGIAPIVSQPTAIATLGPEGTDSEAAAKRVLQRNGIDGGVVLCSGFEAAKDHAIMNNTYLLVPAAYASRDSQGNVVDTWGDFNFRNLEALDLVDSLVLPLKEMCVARNVDCVEARTIALHPATDVFADRFADGLERIYIHSKPLAVKHCSEGQSDMCIGSADVIEGFDNLKVEQSVTPKMIWALYTRRQK